MTGIIRFEQATKRYRTGDREVTAVDAVDLEIHEGEVFGVIGYSGAGKSTLVRLINGLEKLTSGRVVVDGVDISDLPESRLRAVRTGIGMVFQQFNLFRSRTVAGNVAYPLSVAGWPGARRDARVAELLSFVGLLDRAHDYPDRLSGGQKQRVGIARRSRHRRASCSPTSRPARSILRRRWRCSICCAPSTANSGSRSW